MVRKLLVRLKLQRDDDLHESHEGRKTNGERVRIVSRVFVNGAVGKMKCARRDCKLTIPDGSQRMVRKEGVVKRGRKRWKEFTRGYTCTSKIYVESFVSRK